MLTPYNPPTTVAAYISVLPEDVHKALDQLCKRIRAQVPNAEEVMSYGIPTFMYHGMLVGYGAFKRHCSFFVMSRALMEAMKDELAGYSTTVSAIHFTKDKPLPAALVKKIVKARMKENEEREQARADKKAAKKAAGKAAKK